MNEVNEAREVREGRGHDHHHMHATKEKNAYEALSTTDRHVDTMQYAR